MNKKFSLLTFLIFAMIFTLVSCATMGNGDESQTTECTHASTEWRVEKEATCEEDGIEKNICLSCYKTLDTKAISATGHTYVNNKCECGSIQIETVDDFLNFSKSLTYDFDYSYITVSLIDDLDMTDVAWTVPMGSFEGKFEGNGHTISNLKITPSEEYHSQYVGLFSRNNGEILNLTLKNVELIYSKEDSPLGMGCLAGENSGTVQNCHVDGVISVSTGGYACSNEIGGLFGSNTGTVERCSAQVDITAYAYKTKGNSTFGVFAGALIGNSDGTVKNCFATGDITVGAEHYARAAGLIATASGNIENCYATGDSSASIRTYSSSKYACLSGALFAAYGSDDGYVKNCFATGNASADYAADLVPMVVTELSNCYYAGEATAIGSPIPNATEVGSEIALDSIKSAAFGETLTWSTDIWTFTDGKYPTLK